MYLIGLTGGIASGKSVVAARLAQLGAVRVDADELAREVVAPGTTGLAAIASRFGAAVISADGSLDRPALGTIIFSDPDARLALNAITHPAVKERAKQLFARAAERDPSAVIVYDVPLLLEAAASGDYHDFDLIVVVDAPPETRLARLVELRGMSRQEASHRLNSQASDIERLAIADIVIDSSGTMDDTLKQVDALWKSLPRG